jgi:hypothetical protein
METSQLLCRYMLHLPAAFAGQRLLHLTTETD